MKNKKNPHQIQNLVFISYLLPDQNILKMFSKIQSLFLFFIVYNLFEFYEIWRQKSAPAPGGLKQNLRRT